MARTIKQAPGTASLAPPSSRPQPSLAPPAFADSSRPSSSFRQTTQTTSKSSFRPPLHHTTYLQPHNHSMSGAASAGTPPLQPNTSLQKHFSNGHQQNRSLSGLYVHTNPPKPMDTSNTTNRGPEITVQAQRYGHHCPAPLTTTSDHTSPPPCSWQQPACRRLTSTSISCCTSCDSLAKQL